VSLNDTFHCQSADMLLHMTNTMNSTLNSSERNRLQIQPE